MQVYNLASVKIIIRRLERVRQRQEYSTVEQPRMYAGGQAALFEDYAVLDTPNSCFMLGNLVRLVFSSNHGPVEYRPPVSYEDPQKSNITAFLQLYDKRKSGQCRAVRNV